MKVAAAPAARWRRSCARPICSAALEVRGDGRVVERVHPRHGAVEGGDLGAAIVVAVEDARQGRERLRGRLEHRPAVAGTARDVTRPRAQLARTVA